jgi:hypothetical protein
VENCKTFIAGSIPAVASETTRSKEIRIRGAEVDKTSVARDSKEESAWAESASVS